MKQLSARGQRWLKGFHILFAALWVSCGFIMLLLKICIHNSRIDLYTVNYCIHFIDMQILVPAAILCLLSGIAYGAFTRWGFFRHGWIIFKWIVTVGVILFGTFYLGPWSAHLVEISLNQGNQAINNPQYQLYANLNLYAGIVTNGLLIATVFVSVFKPHRKN